MHLDELPLLGTRGGESPNSFIAPSVTSLDTQVDAVVLAHLDHLALQHPPVRMDLLRYDLVAMDEHHSIKLPDRILVLGREEVYGGSPRNSGTVVAQYAHVVGNTPWHGLDGIDRYNYRIPDGLLVRIYPQRETFSPPKKTSIREAFPR